MGEITLSVPFRAGDWQTDPDVKRIQHRYEAGGMQFDHAYSAICALGYDAGDARDAAEEAQYQRVHGRSE